MRGTKFGKWMAGIYISLAICVFLFLVYISITEGVTVKKSRPVSDIVSYSGIEPTVVPDASAPQGIRKIYYLPIDRVSKDSASFAFYAVHSYVTVSIGEEEVYSIKADEGNRYIHSIGSEWIMLPLRNSDSGRTLKIEVMPVYKSGVSRQEEFFIGPRLSIYTDMLRRNMAQIVLCFLAIVCGLLLVVNAVRRYFTGNADTADGYLGLFAIMMGIWKMTDSRFAPLMFKGNPLLLSTVSLAALSLGAFPMLNYMRKQVRLKRFPIIEIASVITLGAGVISFFLQVFNILEYRESLLLVHTGLFVAIFAVTVGGIRAWTIEKNDPRVRMALLCFMLCAVGGFIDLFVFYVRGNSAGIIFTMMAFLAYIVYSGVNNSLELSRRANRDMFTGIYNRSCCNELLGNTEPVEGLVSAFIMMDLNDLKLTNDTKGHEAGDRMILSFVDVIRSQAIPGTFIGRYGGDEFIMFVRDVDKESVERLMKNIENGVKAQNAESDVKVTYSSGWVLSSEMEKPTIMDMFQEADRRMYVEKKKYHESVG